MDREKARTENPEIDLLTYDISFLLVLPDALAEKIKMVLRQLEPYAYLSVTQNDPNSRELSEEVVFLSPERGQILRALFLAEIDIARLEDADFSYADMRNFRGYTSQFNEFNYKHPLPCGKREYDLTGLNLENADFTGANLGWVDFEIQVGMRYNRLTLEQSTLRVAGEHGIELEKINLMESNIIANYLGGVTFDNAIIETDLRYLEKGCSGPLFDPNKFNSPEVGNFDLSGGKFVFSSIVDFIDFDNGRARSEFSGEEYQLINNILKSGNDGNYFLTRSEILSLFRGEDVAPTPFEDSDSIDLEPSVLPMAKGKLEEIDGFQRLIVEFE